MTKGTLSGAEVEKRLQNERDIELMLRVKDRDVIAFEQLVGIHRDSVVATVAKMLGGSNDSEDIAQQVFVRVWKSAPSYKPKAKFTTWLFTITRNLVFNELRRQKRKPADSIEEREEAFHLSVEDTRAMAPDESALNLELEKAIDDAIAALPVKQRMAIILRLYEELSYEDIANVLDTTVPAVKSILFRARTELKESLKQYLNSSE